MRQDPTNAAVNGDSTVTTVAVVGAGLSGLTAARDLHRQGIDVIVLEAADRLGGRAKTETTTLGSQVDLGGQWIGHDHHRLKALAAELGATEYPMHTKPLPLVIDGPRRLSAASPSMLVTALVLAGIEVLSRTGTPERWNATTVEEWLHRVPGRTSRRLLEVLASVSWTADLNKLSIHAMAKMIRNQGGLRTMLSTRGGAQDSLLVEGMGAVVDGLAAELGPRVRPGHRVTSIVRRDRGVTIQTTSGEVRAAKVIVTVPPPMARRIAHEPPLPPDRVELERTTYMGSVYKALAVYERPFWRERNGGEFLVLDKPARGVFDTTSPGGPGHLCVLVGGPAARELDRFDATSRRDVVLGPLTRHVGAEVLEPVSWHEKSWHLDEFAGGGYLALPRAGSTAGLVPVSSAPVGNIHWAGTETATDHAGYLEGAIESGTRAAHEVIAALSCLGSERQRPPIEG
ncbi:monooxygenase [Mycobacterium paraintracellulare]|uniref:FAD-dependent oxidoreductase n=2 Tax=Mycobacterium intracellulare TaxID=1767 RepID=A0AAE4U863_MYCIT|nr:MULTISPECIES: FAD-dependent oxidoreductase [Mycobacterium avium complex (MAC)]MDV6975763.1 FAD-dependent oxidoreductase [Mycobacterium intracellulare]MDV6982122.1 FAD-dependent oxidoreductase [Mycobacterium intracellulare]MDV7011231.1 FAD-dependent oxidoreductase [Mycobacterium intracellulare]MDV7026105.1 FAD-dependent oxidoreductase [Mycobacterium intracellulare]BCO51953.1 monooxygenase [Mycobacterium paraintracellulare]